MTLYPPTPKTRAEERQSAMNSLIAVIREDNPEGIHITDWNGRELSIDECWVWEGQLRISTKPVPDFALDASADARVYH